MSKLIKDLGAVSAYAYAVEKGYTGTEDDFAELMYDYTDVAQTAVEAKDEAVSASVSAQASATTANTKADEASASASKAQGASDSAQGAETNAETFALNAGTKATEAKQFADKAELNAQKTQSDKEAVESAKSDVLSAVDNAQNYANSAQSASQAIQNMNVEATTLEPDSDATVEKTVDAISGAVTLTYGIPKGQVGEKGDKGDTGDSGVYIGTSAPSDENVKVWIDSDGEPDDVIQIDDTLTQSGQAADAKTIGDALNETNERLQQLHDDTFDRVETDITPSLINDQYIWGAPGTSVSGKAYYDGNYVCTDYTEIGNGTKLKVTMNKLSSSSPRGIAFYDSEKVNITGYGMNGGGDGSFEVREFEIPDGAVYFRTCFDETLASRSDFSVKLISKVGGAAFVKAEKARAEAVENALAERTKIIETFKTVSAESLIDSKFISATSGGTLTSEAYVCTPHIDMPFDPVSGYEIRGTFYGYAGCVIYSENGDVLLGIDGSNITEYGGVSYNKLQTIIVPYVEGAKTIRISGYKSEVSAASDLWIKGNTFNDTYEHIYKIKDDVKALEANVSTVISQSKVLVIGDSISTDSYGNYKKWVTRLIESGFLPSDTTNSSRHATGFVARYNNEANDFITRLKAIENPSQYDLVVVFGGINDYIQNIPMGEETGTDYTVSFKPAVNEFFSYLIKNFTQARICVLLPLRTRATWKNSVNEYEWSYSEYIHSVAKSYCLPVLNLTEESGFCPFISTFHDMWTLQPEGYTGHDGVHPNEEYERRFLAPMIKHFLQGMM